jgi:hypothetical protein
MRYVTGNKRAGPMPTMEASLAAFEARIVEAQKSADALSKAFRDLKKAASTGHLVDFEKGLGTIAQRAEQAQAAAAALPVAWDFDSKTYLETGYIQELKQEAQAQGLTLVERDGRLYCFPLVLRIEPRELTIRVGNKRERRLRPKEIVSQLASTQKRKQRFNASKFLDALYQAYQRIQGINWQKVESGPGPAVSLTEIHDLLTLLPISDYPVEEFGRDLLLLARQPDLRTRDGCSFDFPGSTLSKERLKRISVYDEHGREVVYIALRFSKGK